MAGQEQPVTVRDNRYVAFVSYRHVDPDRAWAVWLHTALETYVIPRSRGSTRGPSGRLGRVFLDEKELAASSNLGQEIEDALRCSEFLIIVCSPRTPASQWVNREVEFFREMGRHERVLALLIEGEPAESFPAALYDLSAPGAPPVGRAPWRVEPLAADVRPREAVSPRRARRDALLKIVSRLIGVPFDNLRQRERERQVRRRTGTTVVAALIATLVFGLAFSALRSAREAGQRQRQLDGVRRRANDGVMPSAARALVVEFGPSHPEFGRSWRGRGDPTVLKFNHKVHQAEARPSAGQVENCRTCHVPAEHRDYMRPIRFAPNCESCHPIGLSWEVRLPHGPTDQVLGLLSNLPGLYLSYLPQLPTDAMNRQLTEVKRRGVRQTTRVITADEWLQKNLEKLSLDVRGWWDSMDPSTVPEAAALREALGMESNPDSWKGTPNLSVLELYVMRGLSPNACTTCHAAEGVPQAVYVQRLKEATTRPGTIPAHLSTVATGIPQAPRRWFSKAFFDHEPHSSLACTRCHRDASTSTETRDVLLPRLEDCLGCHAPGSKDRLAAPSDCTTCHLFKD